MNLFRVIRDLLTGRPADPAAISTTTPPPESWQDRVRRLQLPEAERQPVPPLVATRSKRLIVDEATIISEHVQRTGLTKARREDTEYFLRAHHAGKLNGRDLRKFGTVVTADQKRALGIRYRGILTAEFVDTLNDAGRADPEHAAWVIASSTSCALSNAANLAQIAGMDLYAEFSASNMAAGPCPRAAKMDGKRYRPEKALVPPFDDCPHSDQCACSFRATLTLKGEF